MPCSSETLIFAVVEFHYISRPGLLLSINTYQAIYIPSSREILFNFSYQGNLLSDI